MGSANNNDRSLLGNRDSELAVLIMDTAFRYEDIGSIDGATVTRAFARQLRIKTCKKIFDITGGVRPAIGLREAIEKRAAQGSWEAIRDQARVDWAYLAYLPGTPGGQGG